MSIYRYVVASLPAEFSDHVAIMKFYTSLSIRDVVFAEEVAFGNTLDELKQARAKVLAAGASPLAVPAEPIVPNEPVAASAHPCSSASDDSRTSDYTFWNQAKNAVPIKKVRHSSTQTFSVVSRQDGGSNAETQTTYPTRVVQRRQFPSTWTGITRNATTSRLPNGGVRVLLPRAPLALPVSLVRPVNQLAPMRAPTTVAPHPPRTFTRAHPYRGVRAVGDGFPRRPLMKPNVNVPPRRLSEGVRAEEWSDRVASPPPALANPQPIQLNHDDDVKPDLSQLEKMAAAPLNEFDFPCVSQPIERNNGLDDEHCAFPHNPDERQCMVCGLWCRASFTHANSHLPLPRFGCRDCDYAHQSSLMYHPPGNHQFVDRMRSDDQWRSECASNFRRCFPGRSLPSEFHIVSSHSIKR